jgi:hypothetical protein
MAQTTIQGSFLGDGTVTGVKIGADFISAQTALASGLATTDEIIVSDAGVIKKIAMSVWAAATITLTNKSIDLGTNTLTGSVAEFNTALQSESFATLGGTEVLVGKTLTSPVLNTGVSGSAVLDEDNLATNSATQLATQQSIKAYVDAVEGGTAVAGTTDNGILTFVNSGSTFAAEANLTFDGTTLTTPGQIAFPASVALSSNANTLDDYQEGSFTPYLHDWSFNSSEATHLADRVGRYVKIGRFVYFWIWVGWSSIGTLSTGSQGLIGGLPFTAMAGTNHNATVTIGKAQGLGMASAGDAPCATINANTAYISFHVWTLTGGANSMNFSQWGPNPNGDFSLAGFYETNS